MNRTILFLFMLAFFSPAAGQSFLLQWAANPGMDKPSQANSAAVDANGNYFVTGSLSGSGNFNTQGGSDILSTSGGARSTAFLWKLDSSGHEIWARQWNTSTSGFGRQVVTDLAGNAYVCGSFSGDFDADPGPNVLNFHSDASGYGNFILKLDPAGNLIWAKSLNGNIRVNDITIDHLNRLVIAGGFEGQADFDPGPGQYTLTVGGNSLDNVNIFVATWDAAGNFIWTKQVEGNFPSSADAVCVDHHDNILVSGTFGITADFDPGPRLFELDGHIDDGFVWKLDRDGQFIWAVQFSGVEDFTKLETFVWQTEIRVDAADDPIILGTYSGKPDMDPGPGVFLLDNYSETDVFVTKLDPAGGLLWAKHLGGLGDDWASSLALDGSGNIYFTGFFDYEMDMDPGSGTDMLKPGSGRSIFLDKLTPNGDYIGSMLDGGQNATDTAYSKKVLTYGESVFLTGGFGYHMDADPGKGVHDLVAKSLQDIFVQRIKPCATYQELTITSCGPYSIHDSTYTKSGTYRQKLVNVAGCDSILNIRLTVNAMSRPVLGPDRSICAGDVLQLDPGAFASYRWQDGGTDRRRAVSTAGTFIVTVTDTSGCTASDTLVIKGIVPPLSGFLPPDTAMCPFDHLVIRPKEAFQQYAWSDGSSSSSLEIPGSGLYWLDATDGNGCSGRDSIFVGSKDCPVGFHTPNAFTPNGDGLNDTFRPIIWGALSGYSFRVFDRFGEMVFMSTDRNAAWDGHIKGSAAPFGTYTWLCSFALNGAPMRTEKGTVTLIR